MMVGAYRPLPLLKLVWWRCYALQGRCEESPQRRQGVRYGAQPGAGGVAHYAFSPHALRPTSHLHYRPARLYSGSPLRSNRLAALVPRAAPFLLLPHPPPFCALRVAVLRAPSRYEESTQRRQGVHCGAQPVARCVARYAFSPHTSRLTSHLRYRPARLYSCSPLRSNRFAALVPRAAPFLSLPHPPPCYRSGCIIARLAAEGSGVAALPPDGVRPAGVSGVVPCPALRSGHDTTPDTPACRVRYASAPPPPNYGF